MPFSEESGFGLFADEGEVLYTKPGFSQASTAGPVRFWNPVTLAPTGVSLPRGSLGDTGDDANSKLGAFAGGQGAVVRVFDLDTGRKLAELDDLVPPSEDEDRFVWTVDFSPDGKRLVATTAQGHAIVWDTSSYEPVGRFSGGRSRVQFAYYSPDGRYLLTSATTGTILLRDPATHEQIGAPFVGHRGAVIPGGAAAFNADGTRLVTAGVDGQTLLWDVESRTQIGDPWPGGEGGSGSPDGRLAITLVEGHILLWDVDTSRWAATACRAADRNMTRAEWDELGPADEGYRETCD
jgi:WD40 repeat protein